MQIGSKTLLMLTLIFQLIIICYSVVNAVFEQNFTYAIIGAIACVVILLLLTDDLLQRRQIKDLKVEKKMKSIWDEDFKTGGYHNHF